jgi:CDP-paratose 2-epimerase
MHDYGRIFNLPTAVFRMSCIAGQRQFGTEDQGWVAHFLYSALLGNPLTVYGTGHQVRDILYVQDLLDAFELVRQKSDVTRGQVYNVGGGAKNTISLLELLDLIEDLTGKRPEYRLDATRPGDQAIYVTDHSKITRDTGWSPKTSVPEILERIQAFFRGNRGLFTPSSALELVGSREVIADLPRTA